MASAAELFPSREGSSFSVNGGEGMVQQWKVTVDEAQMNPANYLATYHVPIGTVFPWGEFGQVAKNYMIGKRLAGLTWIVWVYYGTPLSIPGAPWRMMVRGASEVEDSVFDAHGLEIRMPVYISTGKYNGMELEDKPQLVDRSLRFTTLITGKKVELYETRGQLLRPVPMDLPVTRMSLIGTTPYLADTARLSLSTMRARVNQTVFYNGAPGTIKFESFEIDSRPGFIEGQPTTGVLHDIALNFVENVRGWDYLLRHEYFDDKTGELTPIALPVGYDVNEEQTFGEPTVTRVVRNLPGEFNDLLHEFGLPI